MKRYKFLEKTSLLLKEILKEKNIDKRTIPRYRNSDCDILRPFTSCTGILGDEYLKEIDGLLSTNLYEVLGKNLGEIIKEKMEETGVTPEILSYQIGYSKTSIYSKYLDEFLDGNKSVNKTYLDRVINTVGIELSDYITCEDIDMDNARKAAFKKEPHVIKEEYSVGAQISRFIKDMCIIRGISPYSAVSSQGVPRNTINCITSNNNIPTRPIIRKLDKCFNTNLEEIIYCFVPKLIKEKRLASGISLHKLETLTGVNWSTISHLGNGRKSVGHKSEKLLEFFDIKIKYMFKMNGEYFYRKPSAETVEEEIKTEDSEKSIPKEIEQMSFDIDTGVAAGDRSPAEKEERYAC